MEWSLANQHCVLPGVEGRAGTEQEGRERRDRDREREERRGWREREKKRERRGWREREKRESRGWRERETGEEGMEREKERKRTGWRGREGEEGMEREREGQRRRGGMERQREREKEMVLEFRQEMQRVWHQKHILHHKLSYEAPGWLPPGTGVQANIRTYVDAVLAPQG